MNENLKAEDSVAITTSSTPDLFNPSDAIDEFHSSIVQSPGYDQISIQPPPTPVEYQMLMSLPTAADGSASGPQMAAVSGTGPIIVGISLPTIDSMATYQTLQPFDLQNARIVL